MSSCYRCGSEVKPNRLKCTDCGAINLLEGSQELNTDNQCVPLSKVVSAEHDRVQTGPWDKCFGGGEGKYGIVRTSATLLGGPPGAGKSTLVLAIAAQADGEVIYLAAEEALPEIKSRADRLGLENQDNILMIPALSGANLVEVIQSRPNKPKMIIIDSLQGLVGEDDALQLEVCKLSKEFAVNLGSPFLIISHVTKSDVLAGRLTLQHKVDTTMTFFADEELLIEGNDEPVRVLDVMKNRFGAARVKTYFSMTKRGLVAIDEELFTESDEE